MIYGDVCTGIGAASAAWGGLGWRAAFFAEIDRFPSRVLAKHYPHVSNHGDFTTIQNGDYEPIDLLVGGTPCQDFSVAGLRAGVAGERGNLTLEFLRLADRLRPRWLVWENVPGVFSSLSHEAPDPREPEGDLDSPDGPRDGAEVVVEDEYDSDESHAFACFLAGLQELGYGFAYRTLDAQYFGVPQRRRRVFVVGHLGDWRRAAAVLFERHSLSGNTPPRREAGQRVADSLTVGANQCSGFPGDFCHDLAPSLRGSGSGTERTGESRGQDPVIACATPVSGGSLSAAVTAKWAKGTGGPSGDECQNLIATEASPMTPQCVAFTSKDYGADAGELASTLRSMGHVGSRANGGGQVAVAFTQNQAGDVLAGEIMHSLGTNQNSTGRNAANVAVGGGQMAVRRLTPRECERLQGFADDYTKVDEKTADGPRYKALGNSMAVPVMRWIGQRIQAVEDATV